MRSIFKSSGAGKIAQGARVPAAKTQDLSLVPRTHDRRGEMTPIGCPLTSGYQDSSTSACLCCVSRLHRHSLGSERADLGTQMHTPAPASK